MNRGEPREATWCCAEQQTRDGVTFDYCQFCGHKQSEPNVRLPHPLEVGMPVRVKGPHGWVGEVEAWEVDEGRGLSVTMPDNRTGGCNLSFDQVEFPLCEHPDCQDLLQCRYGEGGA